MSAAFSDALDGPPTLGAAFELRNVPRRQSTSSSASSSSFDLSSTDSELSFDSPVASPTQSRDTSWSSIDNRDPFSGSAKPLDGLKLYSLPENGSPRSRPSASPPVASTSRVPLTSRHLEATTPKVSRTDGSSNQLTPSSVSSTSTAHRVSPGVASMLHEDSNRGSLDEKEFWDDIISDAIDNAKGHLDLSFPTLLGKKFTYIPRNIADLRNLVVLNPNVAGTNTAPSTLGAPRAFSRVVSAPATYSAPQQRRFGRVSSRAIGLAAAPTSFRVEPTIQLYLSGNSIRSLPRELFALQGLTVLTLRNNNLGFLPPAIGSLTSLIELNISQNKLRFLPAELHNLTHANITLNANPFFERPPHDPDSDTDELDEEFGSSLPSSSWGSDSSERKRQKRILGPLNLSWPDNGRIPPLSELAYRVLLAPMSTSPDSVTSSSATVPSTAPLLNWQIYDYDEWFGPNGSEKLKPIYEVLSRATDAHAVSSTLPVSSSIPSSGSRAKMGLENDTGTGTMQGDLERSAESWPHSCPSPGHRVQLQSQLPPQGRAATYSSALQPSTSGRTFTRSTTSNLTPSSSSSSSIYSEPRLPSSSSSSLLSTPSRPAPFLTPAESRLEWVSSIANRALPASTLVPILWRGCSAGCLSFLEDPLEDEDNEGMLKLDRETAMRLINHGGVRPLRWGTGMGLGPVDSQRTIRPGDDDLQEEVGGDGFDIDELDELGS